MTLSSFNKVCVKKEGRFFILKNCFKLLTVILCGALFIGLSACSDDTNNKTISSGSALSHSTKYPVIWADTESYQSDNDGDNNSTYLIVRYISGDKVIEKKFSDFAIVPENIKKPYVIFKIDKNIDETEAVVHRPPYIRYMQDPIQGKVISKTVTGDNK